MRRLISAFMGAMLALCVVSLVLMPAMAGAATVKGLGSRVELLASGTHTTTTAASTLIVSCTLPAWAHSLQFNWYVPSAGLVWGGAGTVLMNASQRSEISGGQMGSMLTIATTASPPATQGGFALFGPAAAGTHGSVTSTASLYTYTSPIASRTIGFYRTINTAAPTSWNLEYTCHAIGG